MSSGDPNVPLIFISYSHDSRDHKKWVAELASNLVANGIDVILDQWDLGLGDDVPKFMEKSVSRSDRVLMICTEAYVRKADGGKGGVGYEAMIVTGELVRDLGTSKFIPIVKQSAGAPILPKSVATRFYVNMGTGSNIEEQFDLLLRKLHQEPEIKKPPIGKNPFASASSSSLSLSSGFLSAGGQGGPATGAAPVAPARNDPQSVAGDSIADIKVGFERRLTTPELHRYSLTFSVTWRAPRDQDFFNVSLLWPKTVKISKLAGFERREEEERDGVVYEELSVFVEKRLWPYKTIKAIGGNADAKLEYDFDDETHLKEHKLYYKLYSQEWPPVEGEVSFKDLNIY